MISEFPLLVFTVLTGLVAGAYIARACFPAREALTKPWLFPLVCLILTALGSMASILHVGRPELVFGVLANPTSSLTMEGISAGILCAAILVDLIMQAKGKNSRAVSVVVAVLCMALLVLQAHAYATSYGVVAWSTASVWPFIIMTGAAAGFPLALAIGASQVNKTSTMVAAILLIVSAICAAIEAVTYSGVGANGVSVVACGAILLAAAGALALVAKGQKGGVVLATSAIAIIALFVVRYGFYMANIL